MSVTFFCPDAPTTKNACEYCLDIRKWHAEGETLDWPILDGEIIRDEARIARLTPGEMARLTCRPHCNGTQEVSVAPEANFANANARGALALLGLPAENLYGEASPEQCRMILQRIMRLANTEGAVAGLDREATDERQTRIDILDGMPTFTQGPRMIGVPNTSADTLRRIEYLREIFSYGASHNTKVCWG